MSEPQLPKLRYSMLIEWSDEDNAFIVTVPELPGCRVHGKTYAEAVASGEVAIRVWVGGAIKQGEALPEPKFFVFRWWNDDGNLGEPEVEDDAEVGALAQQRG
jgi:predicted RNase H-like HicB family nuclease